MSENIMVLSSISHRFIRRLYIAALAMEVTTSAITNRSITIFRSTIKNGNWNKNGNWKFRYVNGHIDYLLAWRVDAGHERIKALAEDYELIHETEHLKLLRRRSNDSTAK